MSIDVTTINWAEDAARELKAHVYTTLKLPPDLGKRVQQLYGDAERAFDDRASRRQLRVPEDDRDDLDARNGFIDDRKREWLELHTSIPADFGGPVDAPPATRLLECACAVEHAFRALCQQVLEVLARSSPPLAALVAEEARSPLPPPGARESSRGFAESMLRVYRQSERRHAPPRSAHEHRARAVVVAGMTPASGSARARATTTWASSPSSREAPAPACRSTR